MEIFNEQLVKRVKKPKQLIIKILSVALLITIPALCIALAYPLQLAYLIYVAFFIFLIGIYIVWYVFSIQRVEYEYSVSGGIIEVSKIIALRKRKTMCKLQISDIEILDKDEKVIDTMRFAKRIEACADINDENNYYAVFNRPDDSNKGTLGSLLCICGSYGMAGAAIMAGKAALRCGIGLLKIAVPKSIYPVCATNILESVYYPLEETSNGVISSKNTDFLLEMCEKSSAVVIGCGLSVCDDTKNLVQSVITNCEKPLVIDADALNCICNKPEILKNLKAPAIITPHPGEMARLLHSTPKTVNSNRENTAIDFAKKFGVVTVLKGAGTIISSPDGEVYINHTGNSGMATGGSGDVLSGIIGSLLAQGASPINAAAAGVFLHGTIGDLAAEKLGKISMLPTDMIDMIPTAYLKLM